MAAEQAKNKGNEAFKQQKYPLALAHYSTAVKLDPSAFTYPLNRSAVHLKLQSWKDAEKDATLSLDLQPGANAKAYFRRALARRQLGKLDRAKEDLEAAIREGAGDDVKKELQSVLEELKKSEKAPTPVQKALEKTPSPPEAASKGDKAARLRAAVASEPSVPAAGDKHAPAPSNKTSRLRAAISSESTPPPKSSASPASSSDLMTAVSTRKLTKSTSATTTPPPPPPSAAPNSFAAKKTARDSKLPSYATPRTVAAVETASLPTPSSTPPPPPAPIVVPTPSPRPPPVPTAAKVSISPPTTLAHFEHSFLYASSSPSARLALLRSIPPSTLPTFLGSSLTPDLLSALVLTLSVPEALADQSWSLEVLRGLSKAQRFGMSVGMLSGEEKGGMKVVFERAREELKKLEEVWEV